MIKEYKVVWASNLAMFTASVNQAINDDWEPFENLVVIEDPYDSGGHIFYQAMIKNWENDRPSAYSDSL